VALVAALSGAALVAAAGIARADADLDRLETMWERGDYARVMPELISYRERTGVRTPQLDYMIATSACRTPNRRQLGNEFFAWILQNYNLSPDNRTQVETQRQMCSTGGAAERLPMTAPAAMVGVAYHGKGGTGYESQPAGNSPTKLIALIPPEEFARRLFAPADAGKAVAKVASLVGPDFQVEAVGQFVLAAPKPAAGLPGEVVASPSPGILDAAARPLTREGADAPSLDPSRMPTIDPQGLLPNRLVPPPMNQAALPPMNQGAPPPIAQGVPPPPTQTAPPPMTQTAPPPMTQAAPSPMAQTAPPPPTLNVQQDARQMVQQMAPSTPATATDLKRVGGSLGDYLRFFVAEYGMRSPSALITVYFANNLSQLVSLARTLHGIELAPGSIGYSFSPDQSMVGWADDKAYGTFAHELFHVVVRNNFGDIPPFLDEGMAALYEESGFEGNRIVGVPNWRGPILSKGWTERPSIKDLVQMNRSAFDDIAGPDQAVAGDKQSVNHASARYFMLYLQQRGELLAVYKVFLNRKMSDQPAAQNVALLESTLGRALVTVDAEFAAWFKTLPP